MHGHLSFARSLSHDSALAEASQFLAKNAISPCSRNSSSGGMGATCAASAAKSHYFLLLRCNRTELFLFLPGAKRKGQLEEVVPFTYRSFSFFRFQFAVTKFAREKLKVCHSVRLLATSLPPFFPSTRALKL